MSLKITVEVDGQTEQQLTPLIAQFVAAYPQLLGNQGIGTQGQATQANAPDLPQSPDFYHDNSALLKQHIQQLMAQNQLLQQQVASTQQQLAGTPPAKALSPSAAQASQQPVTASAVTVPSGVPSGVSSVATGQSSAPLLPVQYRTRRRSLGLYRIKHSVVTLPARLWQALIWLAWGKEWLLLFVLLCGGFYGTLTLAPWLAERLWPPAEFVDSAGDAPGKAIEPEPEPETPAPEQTQENPMPAQPTTPASKAGSHPPPPPAFQQP